MDTLAAENVVLRKFGSNDVKPFVEAVRESADTVGQWLPWWKADFSEEEARSWFHTCEEVIASGSGFDIGIFRKDGWLADRIKEFGFNKLFLVRLECIAENRLVNRGQPAAAAIYSFICE